MKTSKVSLDWTLFESKATSPLHHGIVESPEEKRKKAKTQYPIAELEDVTYYQLEEKDEEGQPLNKTKLEAASVKVFFPDKRFHIGSAIFKFTYYTKFIIKYSKKYYATLVNERLGNIEGIDEPKAAEDAVVHGYELEVTTRDMMLMAEEDAVAVRFSPRSKPSRKPWQISTKSAKSAANTYPSLDSLLS